MQRNGMADTFFESFVGQWFQPVCTTCSSNQIGFIFTISLQFFEQTTQNLASCINSLHSKAHISYIIYLQNGIVPFRGCLNRIIHPYLSSNDITQTLVMLHCHVHCGVSNFKPCLFNHGVKELLTACAWKAQQRNHLDERQVVVQLDGIAMTKSLQGEVLSRALGGDRTMVSTWPADKTQAKTPGLKGIPWNFAAL